MPAQVFARASLLPLGWRGTGRLFQGYGGPCLFQLCLEFLGFGLGDLFLDLRGSSIHQLLCFLQSETGHLADDLDHIDLLVAGGFEHDIKLGLFFDFLPTGSRAGSCSHGNRSGRGDAEFFFNCRDQLRDLQHVRALQVAQYIFACSGHE